MPRLKKRPGERKSLPSWGRALVLLCIIIVPTTAGLVLINTHLLFPPSSSPRIIPPVVLTTRALGANASGLGQAIINENALPGTTDWLLPNPPASTQIQAYASALSVSPGQELTFYVSTQQAGAPYTVQIFRLGWYGGAGGRLLLTRDEIGLAQGYYDPVKERLVGCSSCRHDPKTNLVEANWRPCFTITIPDNWVTGLYEAKFRVAAGAATAASFEVRGNPHAAYMVVIPDNTTAAYNQWGGYSLYYGPHGSAQTHAFKVSFDRPALNWSDGDGLNYEIDAIRWMERQGYDLSYISSVDLNENPGQLLGHLAFISLGHDEYWSKAMRDGIENARDDGVGLAFFGADAGYWQVRYEPDSHGVADRTLVCYKSAIADPLFGKDNALVTVRLRDGPVRRPENALIGIMYLSYAAVSYPWRESPTASSSLLNGTGLLKGYSYGCDLVGHEWDGVSKNGLTPKGLTILGSSPVISHLQQHEFSSTTYYVAPSGAFVFASGSLNWSFALDNLRIWTFPNTDPCLPQSKAIPGIQVLMEHVMNELLLDKHTGLTPALMNSAA